LYARRATWSPAICGFEARVGAASASAASDAAEKATILAVTDGPGSPALRGFL